MKVAIIETLHFQYALTQAEIFSDCDVSIITVEELKVEMFDYSPDISSLRFELIESIEKNVEEILTFLQNNKIELLLISPVFDSYSALKRIVKEAKCKKVLTTHNINTWFNGRFWSPNSFRDRMNMKSIIRHCDYIAVEDFIYNHLRSTDHKYFRQYKFIYIPFTIFHKSKERKYVKEGNKLKVVLTGAIDGDRRRYEEILEVINYFASIRSGEIVFSFAGRPYGEYGYKIREILRGIKKDHKELVCFFEDDSTADMFRKEMETSDVVLSTSTKTYKGMGTIEYIGKTKPTAAIHDMMSYEIPGLLPAHLNVPENLRGSVFNYHSVSDLKEKLSRLIEDKKLLAEWKEKAKLNSLNFTAEKIRKDLPSNLKCL